VQWLSDGLGIIGSSAEVESLAASVEDNGDVFFVPAFTGMGAPYWDQYARGLLIGLSRGTGRGILPVRALEGIAFQTMDVLDVMHKDTGVATKELRVDGGRLPITCSCSFSLIFWYTSSQAQDNRNHSPWSCISCRTCHGLLGKY
jgi:glycerol kinase